MAINAYTGLMGSGKSYEVVSQVITRAILQGRRIVTNVDSIDNDKVRDYVAKKNKIAEEGMFKLGHIVHCSNADVESENFFYFGDPDVETFCKPGDLIAIDEAWRFFGTSSKIPKNHQIFFREHRHYVHPETGVSCDLVLMVQSINDLNRFLKSVVEVSFKTTKLKAVGRPKNYRVESYEGYKQTSSSLISRSIRAYDPKVFPLYSSYVGGQGKEEVVDSRGSIFSSKIFVFFPIVGVIVLLFSGYFIYKFFKPDSSQPEETKTEQVSSSSSSTSVPVASSQTQKPSKSFKLLGSWSFEGGRYWLVSDENGSISAYSQAHSKRVGPLIYVDVDGQPVSFYSGRVSTSPTLLSPPPGASPK